MKTHFISCLFLFFLFISCENQEKKSIRLENKISDTLKFATKFQQIQSELENQNSKKAAQLNDELFKKANSSGNKFFLGKSYFIKGYLGLLQNESDSAFYYFNQAKENFLEINDSTEIAKSLANMAIIQSNKSDFYGCEITATEALNYAKNQKVENNLRISVYNCLAISSKNLGNYQEAVYWYKKALELGKADFNQSIIQNNLAMVFSKLKQFENANQIFSQLKIDSNVLKNPNLKAKVLDNSAYNKWLKNSGNENLQPMRNALNLRKEIGDDWGQIASNSHLSEFFENVDPKQSLFYARQMYLKAQELNSPEDELEALRKLIRLESPENSKKLFLKYSNLNDSIVEVQNAVKDHFAKIRFDSEQNRKENQKLKTETARQELELEKRKLWIVIFIALIVLISIAVLAFFRIQKIRHQKLINEEIYATEAKISGKIHDDLANNIYRVMSKVENSSDLELAEDKNQILDRLDKVYQLARNISRENAPFETGIQFPEELLSLISAYRNNAVKVILMGFSDFEWKKLSEEKQIQFYKALQEILTNMKKHSCAKLVVLSFKEEKNYFEFFYTDNGIGMNANDLKEKNGLSITENRIVKIKGKFSFVSEPDKGLKIKISIPL